GNGDETLSELEGRSDGLFKARGNSLLDEQAIDDHFNRVVLALIEGRNVVKGQELAVKADTHETVLGELFEFLAIRALSPADDRGEDHDAVVLLRELAMQNGLNDLFARLAGDGLAAVGAVRGANRPVNPAQKNATPL